MRYLRGKRIEHLVQCYLDNSQTIALKSWINCLHGSEQIYIDPHKYR
ncbi:hypothetical protein [Pectobacterium polaris]